MKTIASALVGSRLDYANDVLVRVSNKNIRKLQRTKNTLARIVTWKYEKRGVTQSLKYLHWLPIKWRLQIAVTTYIITTEQLQYLCSRIEHYSHTLSVLFGMLMLLSILFGYLYLQPGPSSGFVLSGQPHHTFGTNCRMILSSHLCYCRSEINLKHTTFG